MATDAAATRLYEQFAPPERLTLLLEALARGDEPEAARLKNSCPQKAYTQADAAYDDRVRVSFEIMTVVCIDLRAMWAKLYALEWAVASARHLATWQQINATMGFIDGERLGRGLPQTEFFARDWDAEAEATDEGAEAHEPADGDDGECDDAASKEFTRRMMAVEARTQHATDEVLTPLVAAAAAVAQDLVEVWAAYGRFCRNRLRVSAEVMMRAWDMPLLGDLELMLSYYTSVKPRPEKVAEYARCCCDNWDRKFGGGDNDGE